jgi:hypothetical protein
VIERVVEGGDQLEIIPVRLRCVRIRGLLLLEERQAAASTKATTHVC